LLASTGKVREFYVVWKVVTLSTHHALTAARQAGTRFTFPGETEEQIAKSEEELLDLYFCDLF